MNIILKYPLGNHAYANTKLTLPMGSMILSVQSQRGTPTAWISTPVESEKKLELTIVSVPTGSQHDWEVGRLYIGTVQDGDGYVWHYFATWGQLQ